MKALLLLLIPALILSGCKKEHKQKKDPACDIMATYTANAAKVTINSGVWGTLSSMEGDCMPAIDPNNSTCTHCPVQRVIRIYEYTLRSNAVPSSQYGFYDSFNTQLLQEMTTDTDGFFQFSIPAGLYTIVIVENGKLYAPGLDGAGGLSPLDYTSGLLNFNLKLTYKAVF
jgi:hypothetical protein